MPLKARGLGNAPQKLTDKGPARYPQRMLVKERGIIKQIIQYGPETGSIVKGINLSQTPTTRIKRRHRFS